MLSKKSFFFFYIFFIEIEKNDNVSWYKNKLRYMENKYKMETKNKQIVTIHRYVFCCCDVVVGDGISLDEHR